MKILITGSGGYIGSCLYEFLKKKHQVFGVDKIFPKIKRQKNFFKCNLLVFNKIDKIVRKIQPDAIIHLAAKSTVDFIDKKNEYIENNIDVTNNILKVINKNQIKHFIFSSTAAVYKNSKNKLSEKSKLRPNNIYGKSKLKCEVNIKKKLDKKKTNYIIFRFFNVCSSLYNLGVGEIHNPETHLIPILAEKFQKNKKIYIYGNNFKTKDKTCIRDYIHIADIVDAFKRGISYLNNKGKSEIINLGSNKGFSTLSIFREFQKFYNYDFINPIFKNRRKGDVDSLICKNIKSYKLIGWKPKNSFISKIINDEKKWLKYLNNKNFHRKTIY